MQGRIKTYNEDRAFGFITGNDGQDYFFHISNWKSGISVIRESAVSFVPKETEKGKVATEIELIGPKPEFVSFGSERLKLSNIKTYGISQEYKECLHTAKVKVYELTTIRFKRFLAKPKYVKNCLHPTGETIKIKEWERFSVKDKSYWRITVHNDSIDRDERFNTKIIKTPNGIRGLVEDDGAVYDEKGNISSIGPIDGFFDGKRLEDKDISYGPMKYLYVTTFQNTNYQWFEDSASFDIYEKCKELDKYLGVDKQ